MRVITFLCKSKKKTKTFYLRGIKLFYIPSEFNSFQCEIENFLIEIKWIYDKWRHQKPEAQNLAHIKMSNFDPFVCRYVGQWSWGGPWQGKDTVNTKYLDLNFISNKKFRNISDIETLRYKEKYKWFPLSDCFVYFFKRNQVLWSDT